MRLAKVIGVLAVVAAFFVPVASAQEADIRVTSGTWQCNASTTSLDPTAPPLVVETMIPNSPADNLNGDARLLAGCTGDGDPETTDLVLKINGNGGNLGSGSDGLVLVGAHDLEIEGYVNCGAPGGGSHQDGIQMNSGFRLTFRGYESGNWDTLTPTCHGAGGIFYVSELRNDPERLMDVVCVGCRMVGSTEGPSRFGTALSIYGSTRSGARGSCFSANIPLAGPRSDAVSPVQSDNLFIDRNSGEPQPDPQDCEVDGDPPPPPPPPPPPVCDEACVEEYEREISTLTEALVLSQAELAVMTERRLDCRAKVAKINRHFHDGKSREKMHRPVHWKGCTGFK